MSFFIFPILFFFILARFMLSLKKSKRKSLYTPFHSHCLGYLTREASDLCSWELQHSRGVVMERVTTLCTVQEEREAKDYLYFCRLFVAGA